MPSAATANARYHVPDGLRSLLEAFARETIRLRPVDVIEFGQLFFEELQNHRISNPNTDIIGDPVAYEMFCSDLHRKFVENNDTSRPNSPLDIAATKIQAAFRGHQVRSHPQKYGIDKSITRTQSSEKMEMLDNKKDQKRHSIGGYTLADEAATPEDRAATKIQAEIRGFLTRKHVEKMKKEDNDAATKIQAHIRGFLTRKHLEETGVVSPSRSRSSLNSN